MQDVTCRLLDYGNARDAHLLLTLLDAYARDPMGGGTPLAPDSRSRLVAVLAATPNAFTLVAEIDRQGVALANCFTAVSTFAARPLVNIHDVYVQADARGKGVLDALFAAVERHARSLGACKITLEVLEGNARARAAYRRLGFSAYELGDNLGQAQFWERSLSQDR